MTAITISRRRARELRSAFRRSPLGLPPRGPIPPLILRAEGDQLRAQYRHGRLAVEHAGPHPPGPPAMLAIPLEALADCEGRDESPVTFESSSPDSVAARWADRGIPRSRDYAVDRPSATVELPRCPAAWGGAPGDLLDALAEASEVAGEPGRYSLDCIGIGGDPGGVAAGDGRQLLIRRGLDLPWGGQLLIDAAAIFACPALPRGRPIRVGSTGTHVVLRAGDWTTWCDVRADARYPDVDGAVPGPLGRETTLRLDPAAARILVAGLGRLPGAGEALQPVTLECNGSVAVRAQDPATGRVAELALGRSGYAGPPVRLYTDRRYLARAARLGCPEIAIRGPGEPLVCRDGRLTYAWQPLDPDGAIDHAGGDAIRLEAGTADRPDIPSPGPANHPIVGPSSRPATDPATPRSPLSESIPHVLRLPIVAAPRAVEHGPAGPAADPAALIAEAERLHATLGEAKLGLARLVAGLRRHRKQDRLVAETLRSLRQLKLADAAESGPPCSRLDRS